MVGDDKPTVRQSGDFRNDWVADISRTGAQPRFFAYLVTEIVETLEEIVDQKRIADRQPLIPDQDIAAAR